MKYIGNFQNHNLPKNEYPKLFAYVDDKEIILSYNENQPFYVEQIAILIDSEFQTYVVFDCGLMFGSDEDVKEFGRKFTSELIEYIRNYQG